MLIIKVDMPCTKHVDHPCHFYLYSLQRFQEAEHVFQQVLQLDVNCEDAQFELSRVRVHILMDMGFTQSLSEIAVRTYSTVQQALEALLAGKGRKRDGLS